MGHLRSITKSKTPRAVLLVLSRGVFFSDKSNLTHSNPKLRVSALPHFFAERYIYYLLTPNYCGAGLYVLYYSRWVTFVIYHISLLLTPNS
jgi:hypothetical protein